MAGFPTTQNPKGLREFLAKIAKNGVPSRLTRDVVKSWGFAGANDGSFITIASVIGFTDPSHVPTDLWRKARSNLPAALGEGLRSGYSELYATFPDAHEREDAELQTFFRTHTDGNAVTVGRMVRTYRAMSGIASFETTDDSSKAEEHARGLATPPRAVSSAGVDTGVTVNINIQLQLPADASADTFDKFFASMKAHLIAR